MQITSQLRVIENYFKYSISHIDFDTFTCYNKSKDIIIFQHIFTRESHTNKIGSRVSGYITLCDGKMTRYILNYNKIIENQKGGGNHIAKSEACIGCCIDF